MGEKRERINYLKRHFSGLKGQTTVCPFCHESGRSSWVVAVSHHLNRTGWRKLGRGYLCKVCGKIIKI